MKKILRYALLGAVVVVLVGCEAAEVDTPGDDFPGAKPTVPLKKRPIVPTTKLPRPRAVECDVVDVCEVEVAEMM